MSITAEQFRSILPNIPDSFVQPLNDAMDHFQINTPKRQAAFLANVAVESNQCRTTVENLNYSASRLLVVFPSHFAAGEVANFDRQPEKIANRVYANRMGNGEETSGDGWNYRGRGLIQLTGKANYVACMMGCYLDCVAHPDVLSLPSGASMSAGWFWQTHELNQLADAGQFQAIVEKVNGGFNALAERKAYYLAGLAALS